MVKRRYQEKLKQVKKYLKKPRVTGILLFVLIILVIIPLFILQFGKKDQSDRNSISNNLEINESLKSVNLKGENVVSFSGTGCSSEISPETKIITKGEVENETNTDFSITSVSSYLTDSQLDNYKIKIDYSKFISLIDEEATEGLETCESSEGIYICNGRVNDQLVSLLKFKLKSDTLPPQILPVNISIIDNSGNNLGNSCGDTILYSEKAIKNVDEEIVETSEEPDQSTLNDPDTEQPVIAQEGPAATATEEGLVCDPNAEYCQNGPNKLRDGSFESPVCSLNFDGKIQGKGCPYTTDQPTYYQADTSILIPIDSQAFFTSEDPATPPDYFGKPEYILQEVVGERQCSENLTAHGNNSFKIFTRGGEALDGGLCITTSGGGEAGINFAVTQAVIPSNPSFPIYSFSDVEMQLGYTTVEMTPEFFNGSTPSFNESQITWVTSTTVTEDDYNQETGYASRYAYGHLQGNIPGSARALCFKARSSESAKGVDTFWDAAFVGDAGSCEIATEIDDGIDRTCGGWACGADQTVYSGQSHTGRDQDYYMFDMPEIWKTKQCEYLTTTNGAPSPGGTLFAGLDLNNCSRSYPDPAQINLNPEYECGDLRNWTWGYAWIGGVKDAALLTYLDCAVNEVSDADIKGTESNPFICDQLYDIFRNPANEPLQNKDPEFWLRFTNTYPGVAMALQAENTRRIWSVPLLGSAVSTGTINLEDIVDPVYIDPYLIGHRNTGNGVVNMAKINLIDRIISQFTIFESHFYEESTIPRNEIIVGTEPLLATNPVCTDIQGEPINKFHYGEPGNSDRAVFGFADDEGTSEHIINAGNDEMSPEVLCDSDHHSDSSRAIHGEVVGSECLIEDISYSKSGTTCGGSNSGTVDITFDEDNLDDSLDSAGIFDECSVPVPTINPAPTPITYGGRDVCESGTICGASLDCNSTLQDVYDACRNSGMLIAEIGGNPFLRWERSEGWRDLELWGLDGVVENTWHVEFNTYSHHIRHENIGIDVNQVISLYDQQIPKCTFNDAGLYCVDDQPTNKGYQVCRRAEPYNCDCQDSNIATCYAACSGKFLPPPDLEQSGLSDEEIREILENDLESPWENLVSILDPISNTDDDAPYVDGEVVVYDSFYTGQYRLANTSEADPNQCTANPGAKTGASQVRIENYYAYAGQIPRMSERIGFAGSNNNDPDSVRQLEIDLNSASVAELLRFIVRGGDAYEYIALPFCDLMTPAVKENCNITSGDSCDCQIRSCKQIFNTRLQFIEKYIPVVCQKLYNTGAEAYQDINACIRNNTDNLTNLMTIEYGTCNELEKSPENWNCDPMANYLISAGFDTPQLQFAKCDVINNANQVCEYEKFGVHLITGPTQPDNYSRAENLGLKWKQEVITSSSAETIDAMAQSINAFDGTSVFRFCNADQETAPGILQQDQSCEYRTELTGSSTASGELAADIILQVASKASKPFVVSPVNEPISEHWAGGDPNDSGNTTTMAEVSEFYDAFAARLDSNPAARALVTIGAPTFNVTAYGNYDNFTRFYNEFTPKDKIDIWTLNMYNSDAAGFTIEEQLAQSKVILADSKPIGLNEIGDFDGNISRLQSSVSVINADTRVQYALFFNAFDGWGSPRGANLVMTDEQLKVVLSDACELVEGGGGTNPSQCVPGGVLGLFKLAADGVNSVSPRISPEILYAIGQSEGITSGITGDANQLARTDATLLSNDHDDDGQILNPCTVAYSSTTEAYETGGCEYDVRGIMQFQNFTFYNYISKPEYQPLMKACIDRLGVDYSVGRTGDGGLKAMFDADGGSYENNIFSRFRVGDNICAAALFVGDIGRYITGDFVPPADWEQGSLDYVPGSNDGNNLAYQTAIRYLFGPFANRTDCGSYSYCDNVATETRRLFIDGDFENIEYNCENTTGYAGTCREIFAQVQSESTHQPPPPSYQLVQELEYSDEVRPGLEEWNEILVASNSYGCDMSWSVSEKKVYCLNMEDKCASCPVRVTATFRHELNHLVSPLRGSGIILSEFSADAVSGNGGWYQFEYEGTFQFATDIVAKLAQKHGVDQNSIISYLQGRGSDPGIDFGAEITDTCHWVSQPRGVVQCANRQVPPGLEASNCQNTGISYNFPRNECGLGDVSTTNLPANDIAKYENILVSIETAIRNCNDDSYYNNRLGIDSPLPHIKYCPIDTGFAINLQCRANIADDGWPATTSAGPLDIIMVSSKFLAPSSKYFPLISQMGTKWATTTESGLTLADGSPLTYPNTLLVNFDKIPASATSEQLEKMWLHSFAHISQGWTTWRENGSYLHEIHNIGNSSTESTTGRFFEACADENPNSIARYKGRERMCALRKRAGENGVSHLIASSCRGNLNTLDQLISGVGRGDSFFTNLFVPYDQPYGGGITIPADCEGISGGPNTTVIGQSEGGFPIVSYKFGNGPNRILLVGGMHGGYEWNGSLLSYELIDYFSDNPDAIPDKATLYIVPSSNPDGQNEIVGTPGRFTRNDVPNIPRSQMCPGRFNSNAVDLNRNWGGCPWQENVSGPCSGGSGGTSEFSESETKALRDYTNNLKPKAVVSYHSVAGVVYLAGCGETVTPESEQLGNTYGNAAGYRVEDGITSYALTGDYTNYLSTRDIPGITVELSSASSTEFNKNKNGVLEILSAYGDR